MNILLFLYVILEIISSIKNDIIITLSILVIEGIRSQIIRKFNEYKNSMNEEYEWRIRVSLNVSQRWPGLIYEMATATKRMKREWRKYLAKRFPYCVLVSNLVGI